MLFFLLLANNGSGSYSRSSVTSSIVERSRPESDCVPIVRILWINNENTCAGSVCWSTCKSCAGWPHTTTALARCSTPRSMLPEAIKVSPFCISWRKNLQRTFCCCYWVVHTHIITHRHTIYFFKATKYWFFLSFNTIHTKYSYTYLWTASWSAKFGNSVRDPPVLRWRRRPFEKRKKKRNKFPIQ